LAALSSRLLRFFRGEGTQALTLPFPNGHFYSPVVDVGEVASRRSQLWPEKRCALPGIDFNDSQQRAFLEEVFPRYFADYDYPHQASLEDPHQFFTNNGRFEWLDSRTLFVMLRWIAPKKMIEVGSGYSSLLAADVNRRFFDEQIHLTCIEPFLPDFLREGVPGISRVVPEKVQDVTLSTFEELDPGDILFIDSSHVAKTGSDVNYLILEVLPRLRPGVVIHFHDIFLPNEYPKEWVLVQRRSWNEQYLVQAMLTLTNGFEVLFGCAYAAHCMPDLVRSALKGKFYGGGSLWIRRTDDFIGD